MIRLYWVGEDETASTRFFREASTCRPRATSIPRTSISSAPASAGISSGALEHIYFQEKEVLCRHLFKVVEEKVEAYTRPNSGTDRHDRAGKPAATGEKIWTSDLQARSRSSPAATANIGRGIALELAREGMKAVGVGRDAEAGASLVAQAKERGAAPTRCSCQADLLDRASPARIVAEAEKLGDRRRADQQPRRQCRPGLLRRFRSRPVGRRHRPQFRRAAAHDPAGAARAWSRGSAARSSTSAPPPASRRLHAAGLFGDEGRGARLHPGARQGSRPARYPGQRHRALTRTFSTAPDGYSKGSRFHPDSNFFTEAIPQTRTKSTVRSASG